METEKTTFSSISTEPAGAGVSFNSVDASRTVMLTKVEWWRHRQDPERWVGTHSDEHSKEVNQTFPVTKSYSCIVHSPPITLWAFLVVNQAQENGVSPAWYTGPTRAESDAVE
jgi:hypothetical protein